MGIGVFGCSLDALDAPEKVAMKLAYLEALRSGRADGLAGDPYELIAPGLVRLPSFSALGRLDIKPWLTPRPPLEAAGGVSGRAYRDFLDAGGCADVAAEVCRFVKEEVFPLVPLMVGVDHSLTGGVLEALVGSGKKPVLVVLDSHLDAVPTAVRAAAFGGSAGAAYPAGPETYNCGTWLLHVIDSGVVDPGDVLVLGPSDSPGGPLEGEPPGIAAYREAYFAVEERGVRVIRKKDLRERGVGEAVAEAMAGFRGRELYISIDADVGAGSELRAVRFLDALGLLPGELEEMATAMASACRENRCRLAGLDIMEIDVHGADVPGSPDRTLEICLEMLERLAEALPC